MTNSKKETRISVKRELKEEKPSFAELMWAADNLIVFRWKVGAELDLLRCDPELEELLRGVLQVVMAKQVELQELAFRARRAKCKRKEQLH